MAGTQVARLDPGSPLAARPHALGGSGVARRLTRMPCKGRSRLSCTPVALPLVERRTAQYGRRGASGLYGVQCTHLIRCPPPAREVDVGRFGSLPGRGGKARARRCDHAPPEASSGYRRGGPGSGSGYVISDAPRWIDGRTQLIGLVRDVRFSISQSSRPR